MREWVIFLLSQQSFNNICFLLVKYSLFNISNAVDGTKVSFYLRGVAGDASVSVVN